MTGEFTIDPTKTLVLRLSDTGDQFRGNDSYSCDCIIDCGAEMFTVKDGHLWQHNDVTGFNNFFGQNVTSKMVVACVGEDGKPKSYKTVNVEANIEPTSATFRTEKPDVQETDILLGEFKNREGIYYAPIKRDNLSPNVSGSADDKMTKGDGLRGDYMLCEVAWTTNALLQLRHITFGYTISKGHETV